MILKNLGIFSLLFSLASLADKHEKHSGHGKHVHGELTINVGVESARVFEVEIDSAGINFFGFEHKPTSKEDLATEQKVLEELKTSMSSWLVWPTDSCMWTTKEVEVERESEDSHSDVEASYAIECPGNVSGSVQVKLGERFKGLEKVHVNVSSKKGQKHHSVEKGVGSFPLE